MKTVGRFTLAELPDGSLDITGPADYMAEKGDALIAAIGEGLDPIFNMTCNFSPDSVTAVGVRLQTDYAGWKGTRDFLAAHP